MGTCSSVEIHESNHNSSYEDIKQGLIVRAVYINGAYQRPVAGLMNPPWSYKYNVTVYQMLHNFGYDVNNHDLVRNTPSMEPIKTNLGNIIKIDYIIV